ncbi:MAG: hypothetical protein ACJ790_11955 [Myxococcaceae bacterium]
MALASCNACKTDKERAAAERAEMQRRYEKSLALTPYRILKLMLRAKGEANEPEAAKELWKLLDEVEQARGSTGVSDAKRTSETAYALIKGMYLARKTLAEHDEDEYPLVWTKWTGGQPVPVPGYDAQMEHLTFGVVWWIIQNTDRSEKVPEAEIVSYELLRAQPQPGWPWGISEVVYWLRGASFCTSGYHYAADEELTSFIVALEHPSSEQLASLKSQKYTAEQTQQQMLAAGYFVRAWNRYGLKREDAAVDDVERGLKALEKLGVENELTWWGWTLVYVHHKNYPEAAEKLEKMAQSPYVDEKTRNELHETAESMKTNKQLPLIGQARAMSLVAEALVARAGGLEKLLGDVVGEKAAHDAMKPIRYTQAIKQGIDSVDAEKVEDFAKETAKAIGSKGVGALKNLVQKDGG